MRVLGCIVYAMVPEEKRGKLDAKGTKCLFLGYCEGTKAYRLMCVQSKKIIKCRDIEFMEDNTSVGNDLEMRPSGRNETPNVVIPNRHVWMMMMMPKRIQAMKRQHQH
jgi:hypothetical protein